MAEFPIYEQMAKNVAEKALDEFLYDGKSIREWMKIIVEQEPKWIPVSERLPKETGWYLITFKVYGGSYAVCEMCYRRPGNYWTRENIGKKILDNDEVIAWMPLPEPYKAERTEK